MNGWTKRRTFLKRSKKKRETTEDFFKKQLTKPRLSDKIHHVPTGTYALVAQLDRVTDYESVGRGFESLPSHQEKPVHVVCWFFFFVCAMEGARTGRRRIAPQAISPVGCCLARGFQRVGMSTVEAVNRKISWLFCFVSHGCTVFARSVLSMSDDVGRCIALQSVPFFASGEQGQAELCLHFRVDILEQFQKSRHGD